MSSVQQSREAEAFFAARRTIAPDVVSACAGWTAHEVTAHLVAGAVEVSRHLEPYLNGDPVPATRGFEEREAPFRAMSDPELMRRLELEDQRLRGLLGDVLAIDRDAVIPWTGRRMPVAMFLPHLRSEFAVHRWDITGDDGIGDELLAQPELTSHAVRVLGPMLLASGVRRDPSPEQDFHVRLRSPGAPDIRLSVESGCAELGFAEAESDEPGLDLDAAARLLVLWGRRPERRDRIRSTLTPAQLTRLHALLAGY
ncbi:maleylpyruvate isomerase N-terminal domain-containing protein [Nocardia sp. MDA0666]|uniref:maleylpyruvate isomerase N-terminal domain-containing protein n=1 Tax=Nocardia sp. MDA0666 TaxID=2135448 RepID=UPI001304FAB7|nr:maleylpyruvate isomerase N-terminal domain-containing protein [Nocardia sp. MDA0666]